jgi:RNA polymerase sigma-70 factor (ECF subfamily)
MTVSPDNSVQLIQQMGQGNRGAFELFYERYAPLVFSFAMRLVQERSAAEDLLQEVFLQVWREAGNYSPARGTPEAWIITITRSRGIDRLRSIRRRDKSFVPIAGAGGKEYDGKVESGAAVSDARIMVNSALAELPPPQRRVLELAYFDGLSQSEISERLKEPLGTVKTRMRAALARLREIVGAKAD